MKHSVSAYLAYNLRQKITNSEHKSNFKQKLRTHLATQDDGKVVQQWNLKIQYVPYFDFLPRNLLQTLS